MDLIYKINENYSSFNHKEVLYYIEKYLNLDNAGIFPELLHKYIKCQINLGMFEEAEQNLTKMNRLFPLFYSNFDMAVNYASISNLDKLNKCLYCQDFSSEEYFAIARACFLNGLIEQSKKLFHRCLSDDVNLNGRAQEYLRKIELYNKNKKAFVRESYSYFKNKGKKLMPGHIVHVATIRSEYNENAGDLRHRTAKHPYMVWEIVDDKVYAFPVLIANKYEDRRTHLLFEQDYPGFDFDRKISDSLTCLKDTDIDDVMGFVNEKDFLVITRDIYESNYISGSNKKNISFFMEAVAKKLKPAVHDLVTLYDFEEEKRRRYFVLSAENNKFQVVAVNYQDRESYLLNAEEYNQVEIDMNTPFLRVSTLTDTQKEHLLCQLSAKNSKLNPPKCMIKS